MKLLTEAEWRTILRQSVNYDVANSIICDLRERGMIAPEPEPEPVDPLAREADEIADAVYAYKDPYRAYAKNAALTALRRNLERPTLTREMVWEAVHIAARESGFGYIDALHAALVERLK
jgi:hypothetical protein